MSYTLYGSEFSLYTGKLRSYLRKKGLEYHEVLATAAVYKKFIVPRTGVQYIPVLQTPDDLVLQDTTVIIDELERRHPEYSIYPSTAKQKLLALLLELYADEWLVIPAMHYRWNFPALNEDFIHAEFGRILLPRAPAFLRRVVGKKLAAKFKGFVPGLGIGERTIAAIEHSYIELLKDLNSHFEQHDFLLGERPSIADFGFFGPLYAHLYRDPAPARLMRRVAPNVCSWVQRMNNSEAYTQQREWLANDAIPATLLPILQRMVDEQLPVLKDTKRLLDQWRSENPAAKEIPRSIGQHDFSIADSQGQRMVMPYSLWMLQRAVAHYQQVSRDDELDAWLSSLGLLEMLQDGLEHRISRPNNKMEFADQPN